MKLLIILFVVSHFLSELMRYECDYLTKLHKNPHELHTDGALLYEKDI